MKKIIKKIILSTVILCGTIGNSGVTNVYAGSSYGLIKVVDDEGTSNTNNSIEQAHSKTAGSLSDPRSYSGSFDGLTRSSSDVDYFQLINTFEEVNSKDVMGHKLLNPIINEIKGFSNVIGSNDYFNVYGKITTANPVWDFENYLNKELIYEE